MPEAKNKAGADRDGAAKPGKRKAAPAPAVAAPSAAADGLQQLKDELQTVNQRLSKIGRVIRPGSDAAKRPPLPEKQDLLARKAELERKIRASSRT
jgi:hypothetical protein